MEFPTLSHCLSQFLMKYAQPLSWLWKNIHMVLKKKKQKKLDVFHLLLLPLLCALLMSFQGRQKSPQMGRKQRDESKKRGKSQREKKTKKLAKTKRKEIKEKKQGEEENKVKNNFLCTIFVRACNHQLLMVDLTLSVRQFHHSIGMVENLFDGEFSQRKKMKAFSFLLRNLAHLQRTQVKT